MTVVGSLETFFNNVGDIAIFLELKRLILIDPLFSCSRNALITFAEYP